MMRLHRALALVLGLATGLFSQSQRAQVTPGTLRQGFPGAWQLISAKDYRPSGEAVDWLGKAVIANNPVSFSGA